MADLRPTQICAQVLEVLELATRGEFDRARLRSLTRRAEQIARGRRSHRLGVRHLVLAMLRMGYLRYPVDAPEGAGGGSEDL